MFKPARILVPTDMSDHSFKAIRQSFDIARQYDSEVFILHVVQKPVQECAFDYCISEELAKELQRQMDDSARKGVQQQLAKLPGIDRSKVSTEVKTGNPYEEILKEAEAKDVDLIVISSFGYTGLASLLMGSVARHVLMGSKRPVLLVK
jgi:nucleotide-binding universal stress UspA family protein